MNPDWDDFKKHHKVKQEMEDEDEEDAEGNKRGEKVDNKDKRKRENGVKGTMKLFLILRKC